MDKNPPQSVDSDSKTPTRNLEKGYKTKKSSANRVQRRLWRLRVPIIFVIGSFGTIFYFKMFGPSAKEITISLILIMVIVTITGVLNFFYQRDMQEPQPPGPRTGDEYFEYIFRPTPEFEQAYPNHPYRF